MQFLAITAFAATALAAATPQRFNPNPAHFRPGGFVPEGFPYTPPGECPNNEYRPPVGDYFSQCSCKKYDWSTYDYVQDDDLGKEACDIIHRTYDNVYFQPGCGCVDRQQQGVDVKGIIEACAQAAGPFQSTWVTCQPPVYPYI